MEIKGRMNIGPVEPTGPSQVSVQSINYCPETMSSVQRPSFQHRKGRRPPEQCVGAMTSASITAMRRSSITGLTDAPASVQPMVPEAAAEVSEMPTATSERRVIGRTDALAPEVPTLTQKNAQRL